MTRSSGTREASVDGNVLPSDISVFGAGEPGHKTGDLVHTRHALHGDPRDNIGDLAFTKYATGQLGVGESRCNAVRNDSICGMLDRQSDRHAVQGKLARRVGCPVLFADLAPDRADIDDPPPTLSLHR